MPVLVWWCVLSVLDTHLSYSFRAKAGFGLEECYNASVLGVAAGPTLEVLFAVREDLEVI